MREAHFSREPKISRSQAGRLVLDLANYSDWRRWLPESAPAPQFSSAEELEQFCRIKLGLFDEDYEFMRLFRIVERARVWDRRIPYFEQAPNFSLSLVDASENVTLSVTDHNTGKTISTHGNFPLIISDYQSKFYNSWQTLDRALGLVDYAVLMSAISEGISGLDSYLTYRAEIWNVAHPAYDHILDAKGLCFENKIDEWIPRMCANAKFDKSGRVWQSFRPLKIRRDNLAQHSKMSMYDTADFQSLANNFTLGIAGFLFELHKVFQDITPAFIIKRSYAPKVIWVPES